MTNSSSTSFSTGGYWKTFQRDLTNIRVRVYSLSSEALVAHAVFWFASQSWSSQTTPTSFTPWTLRPTLTSCCGCAAQWLDPSNCETAAVPRCLDLSTAPASRSDSTKWHCDTGATVSPQSAFIPQKCECWSAVPSHSHYTENADVFNVLDCVCFFDRAGPRPKVVSGLTTTDYFFAHTVGAFKNPTRQQYSDIEVYLSCDGQKNEWGWWHDVELERQRR